MKLKNVLTNSSVFYEKVQLKIQTITLFENLVV